MNYECKPIKECVACGSKNLVPLLDLNSQPLANEYKNNKFEPQQEFPLAVNRCGDCFHVQLTHQVNPELMFKDYDYVSGTSKTQLEYFDKFVSKTEVTIPKAKTVLDIGCNDGSFLNSWRKFGFKTYGVDPAENLYKISSKNHNVHCGFFTGNEFDNTKFDVITCFNAFAHNENQLELLKNMSNKLNDGGTIYISTSQSDMIVNGEFDTIYHEHLSFYNISSMMKLCERAGVFLLNVKKHPIHGNSYIFTVVNEPNMSLRDDSTGVNEFAQLMEKESALYEVKTYENFSEKAYTKSRQFATFIRSMRASGIPIIGYGAPAKGNTLMNFAKEGPDMILEDNPLKQGKFTPGLGIPIIDTDTYYSKEDVIWIPLAWNFFDEIKDKIKTKRPNNKDRFLKTFPTMEIVE